MKDKAAAAVEFLAWFLVFFLGGWYMAHGQTVPLPDHAKTPGVVDSSLIADISGKPHMIHGVEHNLCAKDFRTSRFRRATKSEAIKKRVCLKYGIKTGCPGPGYELDDLDPVEDGGMNVELNLWPEPVDAPGVIGFHTKDKLENRLHRMVCSGKMSLKDAQTCIAGNWYKCMAHVNSQ